MSIGDDYLAWHPLQVATGDIDPVYPLLDSVATAWNLSPDDRAWLVFLHVAWYHTGSTFAAFDLAPSVSALPETERGLEELGLLDLPCMTERRGHRDRRQLAAHLLSLGATLREEGTAGWADSRVIVAENAREAWKSVESGLLGIFGNGRWASYKTAEMLQKVAHLDLSAPDAGHKFSSGPRRGLEILEPVVPAGNSREEIALLDFLTECWADELGEKDLAQVETSLCDFYSLAQGRYYLGHDIDSMLAALNHPAVAAKIHPDVRLARLDLFDDALLGEVGGWAGVRVDLNRVYRDTGQIFDPRSAS